MSKTVRIFNVNKKDLSFGHFNNKKTTNIINNTTEDRSSGVYVTLK